MISVVACTNRIGFIPRIIENFERQTLAEKELILIVNSDEDCEVEGGVVFPGSMSLGECLNRGVEMARYPYVAKFDDDDYYGPEYLAEAYQALLDTGADLVGKSSFYVHFQETGELRLYNPGWDGRMISSSGGPYRTSYFMSGATLVFRKDCGILFPDVNKGEDSGFQRLCYANGLKMYSLSKDHYAYIRYRGGAWHHHSDVGDALLRRRSRFVARVRALEDFFEK